MKLWPECLPTFYTVYEVTLTIEPPSTILSIAHKAVHGARKIDGDNLIPLSLS